MVHRMQRMTMVASNPSKNPSAAGGQGASAGKTNANANTFGVTPNTEQSAAAPPNSPYPSSPKNPNKTTTDHSSSDNNPKKAASTTAPTTAST